MYSLSTIGASLLALASFSSALVARQTSYGADCVNGPTTRQCWGNGFDISTDFGERWPNTGKVRSYDLVISRQERALDGTPRPVLLINGQTPGPTIEADWGDIIQVTVTNTLNDNGTSIHWHGMRQLHSNQQDGTNAITECPIAPGESKVYTFKATEYGSSWYHSHFSLQSGEGLKGGIKINGPSTANYDNEGGVITLADWFHTPVFTVMAARPRAPPRSQSILVNGKGTLNGVGEHSVITVEPGKKTKLSFVNTGVNAYIHISFDQHPMQVIAMDFIPIEPYTTNELVLSIGQRYDIVIDASETPGSYWFRVKNGGGQCDGPNEKSAANDTQGAILQYAGAPTGVPTSEPYELTTGCAEELEGLVPWVKTTIPPPASPPTLFDLTLDTQNGAFWKVNGVAIAVSWVTPTLQYVQNGTYTLPADDNGLTITGDGWTYWTIQNDTPVPHPIHLHGHNFYVIAQGQGSGQGVAYNLDNPIARDTHSVNAGGYITIAFPLDNPGVWLLHCHVPLHAAAGLAVQFLENPSQILETIGDMTTFNEGCRSWAAYQNAIPGYQTDSGLKRRNIRRA